MPDARVKIDTVHGLIELEGEREFVASYLDKLLPIIEAVGLGTPAGPKLAAAQDNNDDNSSGEPSIEAPSGQKRKQRPARPPAGASCRDRILTLKTDGFFKGHRSPTDIVGALAKKGWTHKVNQVGAALTVMFHRGEIQRTKIDGGTFKYYWDRS